MLSFFPGPSKVYPQVRQWLTDAYDQDILSLPHRGQRFMEMSRNTVEKLKEKLAIPADYSIYFTASATECWEIILQGLVAEGSFHFFSGAFGEKWHSYAQKLQLARGNCHFEVNERPAPEINGSKVDLICLTHSETSNGTVLPDAFLKELRSAYPEPLIAVDATSSMAGMALQFPLADVWFASVQKCFGLPAGLGLLICSPRAVARAKELNHRKHYNSLVVLDEQMQKFQTYNTPNVLGIYLFSRSLEITSPITATDKIIRERAAEWYAYFGQRPDVTPLVSNPEVRSPLVLALQAKPERVKAIKELALAENIRLGNGYGTWAESTFRIANFPQHTEEDFEELKQFFESRAQK
jgi:phosphoserine aminotransferase